jgi:cytochrome c oxidase subunit 2
MRRTWLAKLTPLLAFLAVGVGTAAAQTASGTSNTEELIFGLNERLLIVAIPITVLTEAILIYTVWKFSKADEAKPTKENRRLEITWTVATAVILLFVGLSAYTVLGQPAVTSPSDAEPGEEDMDIHVEGQTWQWNVHYPDHNVTTTNVIYMQTNQTTYLNVTGDEWLHAVHVPALGLKQDAVPGQYNTIQTTPQKAGTYQGYCAEYCGVGHSGMLFEVVVVDSEEELLSNLREECDGNWSSAEQQCT